MLRFLEFIFDRVEGRGQTELRQHCAFAEDCLLFAILGAQTQASNRLRVRAVIDLFRKSPREVYRKMQKTLSLVFGLCCFLTSYVSSSLLGVGIWFWIIIGSGIFVAASAFLPALQNLGVGIAGMLAGISVVAVLLIVLAASIGGSFELGSSETALLLLFAMIAITGFTLGAISRRKNRSMPQ